MRIPSFIKSNTLKLNLPYGKTIFTAILLLPILLILLEGIFRIFPLAESILIPTIDGGIYYPEFDIKFHRLGVINSEREINCIITGDSTVDFGINPKYFVKEEIAGISNPVCFNFALEGMMPETAANLITLLNKRYSPSIVIVGINPLDFATRSWDAKYFKNSSWFEYYVNNRPSLKGWLVEHSYCYKYLLAFQKKSNPQYRSELTNQQDLIDSYGFQVRQKQKEIYQINPVDKFSNYQLAQEDLNGFKQILSQNRDNVRVIVVEMPVHPSFLAYNISGGKENYEKLFLHPIEKILKENNIPFYPTQYEIGNIVDPDGWIDNIHLNEKGARQFSVWLVNQMEN